MTGPVLITTDAVGGVWNYSLALAEGFVAAGTAVLLAVVGPKKDKAFFSEEKKQKTFGPLSPGPGLAVIHTGLGLDWTAPDSTALSHIATSLARLAAEHGATSAHLHAPCLADADWPIPTITTAHSCIATWWRAVRAGRLPPEMAHHHAASQAGLIAATATIAPTHAFAQALAATYTLPHSLHIIHNGLPTTPPAPTQTRQNIILTAGRLWDEGKNLATLDRAAPLCHLPIHAAGPTQAPHGGQIQTPNITLLGNLPNPALRALMAQSAVFAAPSLYEPFGLAVLEAAQAATPLVLSDIPTFRELWSGAALFVPPNDPQAWATTLNTLAANPAQCAQLGQAAQTRAATYTQSAMVHATLALHTTLQPNRQAA